MADRTSRDTQTRERQERKVWRPGTALEAPEAPLGYTHRWIRESVMEFDDKTNVHKRRQEGYELVRAEEYPEYAGPVVDEGRNAGIIGVGGLVLARIPKELADQRFRPTKLTYPGACPKKHAYKVIQPRNCAVQSAATQQKRISRFCIPKSHT